MEEHSFQDKSSSVSGNSGSLGTKVYKPKLKPVRVKALLEAIGSDDDSEDRERDSEKSDDSDDTDDYSPLPEDTVSSPGNDDCNLKNLDPIIEATLEVSPINDVFSKESVDSEKRELTKVKENLFMKNPVLCSKYTEDKLIKTSGTSSSEALKVYPVPSAINSEKPLTNNLTVLSISSESRNRSKSFSAEGKPNEPALLKEQQHRTNESSHSIFNCENRDPKNFYRSRNTPFKEFSSIQSQKILSDDGKRATESSSRQHEHLQVQRNNPAENASALSSHMVPPSCLANETPLKHSQIAGATRPTPCHSQKNLFATPQNKIESDYQKNYAQTPATIYSHWSQSRLQTPLQNQVVHKTTASSSSKQELPRYYSVENKNVRRPLAETMKLDPHQSKENFPIYSREPRQSSLECHPKLEEKKSPNKNDQLHTALPSIHHAMPDKENLIIPRIMSSNLSQRMKVSKTPEKAKDFAKIYPTMNEPPKILERVPIAPPHDIQCTQKDEFLRVKNVKYRNLGIIGKGMSGKVYRVQNVSTNELRAIKFVDLSKLEKDGIEGCLEEIRMLHKLQAPCIIRMYDYEVSNSSIYVVMEMGDTDLSNLIKANSVEKDIYFTLYYWKQMLTAVNHIHKNGVIHSDLKPGNFVLVKGALKLIDFGIASSINSDMTSVVKNTTTGTLNYISPEALTDVGNSPTQSAKHKINCQSDVWALGCILYSLVYGQTPFQDIRNQYQKISAIINPMHKISFPPYSGDKSQVIPPVLIDVMRRCLNRDKKARPTVQHLLEVSYIPTQTVPRFEIPIQLMTKIRQNRLSEEEWRQFTEILEQRRQA